MIKKVIYQLLNTDEAITSLLSTYPFADDADEAPAIFTMDAIPEDAKYPAIHIAFVGGSTFGCRAQRGADMHVDVTAYDDKELSLTALDQLAMKIWERCDRADLSALLNAEGYEDWGCRADPPTNHGDENSYPGYLIRVHARVLKQESLQ